MEEGVGSKPCPHCGAVDHWFQPLDWFAARTWWGCLHCGWMHYRGPAVAVGPGKRAYHTKHRKRSPKTAVRV